MRYPRSALAAMTLVLAAFACANPANPNDVSEIGTITTATEVATREKLNPQDTSVLDYLVVTTPLPEPYEDERLGFMRFTYVSSNPWENADLKRRTVPMTDFFSGSPAKDGIPAILDPKFETLDQADTWLDPLEAVIVFELNSDVRVYPIQILMFHEIVNDVVDGQPVLVSY